MLPAHRRKQVGWPFYLGPSGQPRIRRGDIDADGTFPDGAVPAATNKGLGTTMAAVGQHAHKRAKIYGRPRPPVSVHGPRSGLATQSDSVVIASTLARRLQESNVLHTFPLALSTPRVFPG